MRIIKLFNKQRRITQANYNLVVQHFEPQYTKPMKEEHARYNNYSVVDLFKYLHNTHRTITYKDLEKNEEEMKQP